MSTTVEAETPSRGGDGPFLSAARAVAVFIAYQTIQIIVAVAAAIVIGIWYVSTETLQSPRAATDLERIVVMPASLIAAIAAGAVAFWMTRRTLRTGRVADAFSIIGWKRPGDRELVASCIAGLALSLVYLLVLRGASSPSPNTEWGPLTVASRDGGWPRHLWAVLMLLVAPIVEEFVFRGVILAGFCRSWMRPTAGALVTLLFVATHLEAYAHPPALIAIALMGGATVVARVTTGSLIPPIVLHTSYNLGIVVAVYLWE